MPVKYPKGFTKEHAAEYQSWCSMRQRCVNPSNPYYHRYGGRGIKVCGRWDRFDNFVADMGKRPGPEYSIERVHNSGNYEPRNCIWATAEDQAQNRDTGVPLMDKINIGHQPPIERVPHRSSTGGLSAQGVEATGSGVCRSGEAEYVAYLPKP